MHLVREIAELGTTKSEKTKEVSALVGVEVEVGAVVAVASTVLAEAETTAGVGVVAAYVSSMFITRFH